jgi:hypothetical protein
VDTVGIMRSRFLFLDFILFFLVFLLFAGYEFWFVLFMECRQPDQELEIELCFSDFLLF